MTRRRREGTIAAISRRPHSRTSIRQTRRFTRHRPLFPGYLFFEIVDFWRKLFGCDRVNGMLKFDDDKPALLPQELIDELREREGANGVIKFDQPKRRRYGPGAKVRVRRVPASQGRIAGYRIGSDQSAGIGATVQPVSHWRGRLFSAGQAAAGEDLFDLYLPLLRHEQQPGFGLALLAARTEDRIGPRFRLSSRDLSGHGGCLLPRFRACRKGTIGSL